MNIPSANVHTAFGNARTAFARGDLATTENLCLTLIADFPQAAEPWNLLSETALRRGRPDAAIVCANKAVALNRRDPIAHLMQAKCLMLLGRLTEARAAADAGIGLASGDPVALDGFGAILSMLGDHAHAIVLFGTAQAAQPENPQILYNLAAAERMIGRLADAEHHANQVIARDPHYYPAYYLRADLREQTAGQNHVGEMEALLRRGVRHVQGEILLRFALGKECEDIGDFARAFVHIETGANLHRQNLRYAVKDEIDVIDRIIAGQTREALGLSPMGYEGDDPVFIVGLPRSGTTLAERIVGSHSAVRSAGELGAFPAELRKTTSPTGTIDSTALGLGYSRAARQNPALLAHRFIDKFPGNYLNCGAIHAALPTARIIAVRRNPMDSCFALYKAHFAGSYRFSYDLEEMADYYAAFDRLMAHWRAVLPAEAFLEIAYEDIVADPQRQSRAILAFLGLPWEEDVLRFYESSNPATTASAVQVRRPIYASSVGKWLNYATELAPLRVRLAERGIAV